MLISRKHQQRYREYYASRSVPAPKPHAWQPIVDQLVQCYRATSVLDYGCGPTGALAQCASYPVVSYDPGIPAFAARPDVADIVVCAHTLEHVELRYLTHVLRDLFLLARKAIVCFVSCEPSTKLLPDGTPWHTIVEEPLWWHEQLLQEWGHFFEHTVLGIPMPTHEYRSIWYVKELHHE